MFPVPDNRVPEYLFFQFLMSLGFAQTGLHAQHQHKILVRFNTVGLGCFHQRVNNGTGFRFRDTVTEQTVLSADYEGPDRIHSQIIRDRYIPIIWKGHELLLLFQRIPYCILQFAALFGMDRFQPCKLLLQKGTNHVLAVIFMSFDICEYVLLLQGEQLCEVLESTAALLVFTVALSGMTFRHFRLT